MTQRSRSEIRKDIEVQLYVLLSKYPNSDNDHDLHERVLKQLNHHMTYGDEDFCFDLKTALGVDSWDLLAFADHPDVKIFRKLKSLELELNHEHGGTHEKEKKSQNKRT